MFALLLMSISDEMICCAVDDSITFGRSWIDWWATKYLYKLSRNNVWPFHDQKVDSERVYGVFNQYGLTQHRKAFPNKPDPNFTTDTNCNGQ